ncbi:MAG: phosphotransferase, partial [Simkaniaceae bacterium]|nr:phosphotransferase [Simkaniaceae bacterium]
NGLSLSDRIWECPSCKKTLDRDINAAKNILTVGLAGLAFGESGRLGNNNLLQSCSLWIRNPLVLAMGSCQKEQFALQSATFTHIDHTDTIIAEVYKVTTSDNQSFILKICPRVDDYFREVYFLCRLKGCIPVPRMIASVEPSSSHFGAILMEYLEGELLKEEDWTDDLAFEMGVALARLHNNRIDGYGDLTKPKTLTRDAILYFNKKFLEELDECKGHLPENLIEKCNAYLDSSQSLLANVDGPCLVHRDFRLGNMIVCHGQLQGIIDWASARSGFAEQDFCSIEQFKWGPHARYKKSFLDGYSSVRPIPNYQLIMPLLQLGRALAVVGYTVKSNTWNNSNSSLYTLNRQFLDSFDDSN